MNADPARLEHHVRELSENYIPRDSGHPDGMNRAAAFIYRQFESITDNVDYQIYTAHSMMVRNVRAFIGPNTKERFIVGAHYDVAGPFPGADDNASGVAGLLELARLLNQEELPRQVELVSYPLEEPPYFYTRKMGSYIHAQSLKDKNEHVIGMLALEMIGYFNDDPGSQRYPVFLLRPFYPSKGNFIAVVGKLFQKEFVTDIREAMRKANSLPVESINAPKWLPGIALSDHLNYWRAGYRAAMITDTAMYRNPNYHTVHDTPDTLDYNRMAQVVDGVYNAVLKQVYI